METCLDRKRGGRLMTEVNDEHGTMTVCVGSGDEWREAGKMGLRAQRLAYISFRPPWLLHPNFFFFLPLNGLFSPVCPMNYVNDYGLPFFPGPEEEKIEVREMPPPHFFQFLMLPLNNLSCWQCGPGLQLCGHVKRWWWLLSWWRGRVRAQWHIRGTEEAGKERMPALLLESLTLINETEKDRAKGEKIRREGWHWCSRPDMGQLDSRSGERLRKSPRLHYWSGRG